jgi:hypothetical protein
MADIAALLANAKRAELPVDVYLGPPELPIEYGQLKDDERDTVGRRMREHTLTTRVRALPHREWAKLVAAHPPRDDVAADRRRVVNMSTFFDVAVPPCLVDLTADQYEQLDRLISEGEWDKLCSAVWAVNTGSVEVPFSQNGSPTFPSSDGT